MRNMAWLFLMAVSVWALAQAPTLVNSYLSLEAFPGSSLVSIQEDDDGDSEVVFTADAELRAVFDFFDGQLLAAGWERTDLEVESREIEADYRQGSVRVELELEQQRDGSFELDIDIEND